MEAGHDHGLGHDGVAAAGVAVLLRYVPHVAPCCLRPLQLHQHHRPFHLGSGGSGRIRGGLEDSK